MALNKAEKEAAADIAKMIIDAIDEKAMPVPAAPDRQLDVAAEGLRLAHTEFQKRIKDRG